VSVTEVRPSTNGHREVGELAALHEEPINPHLLRGYGPFAVGVVLFVLMVILTPTVAPERVVDRPIETSTTTTTVEPSTTSMVPGTSTTVGGTTDLTVVEP
jgi:hypothetical protein